ncbi:uncharacterized protein LOC126909069 isoform X2 [Daktulosphaira vitifoliae]|nr:uncharacterized protein LOC126909069 isoform X2 [Daktulosphaira vitifoliae]
MTTLSAVDVNSEQLARKTLHKCLSLLNIYSMIKEISEDELKIVSIELNTKLNNSLNKIMKNNKLDEFYEDAGKLICNKLKEVNQLLRFEEGIDQCMRESKICFEFYCYFLLDKTSMTPQTFLNNISKIVYTNIIDNTNYEMYIAE